MFTSNPPHIQAIMTFQTKYILFSEQLTEMFGLPHSDCNNLLSEDDINAGIIKYVLANKGLTEKTLNYDRVLWRALDLNQSMIMTTESIWNYLAKYLEEAP